jgi:hypothetical protein
VHPGAIVTDLIRHMSQEETEQTIETAKKIGVVKDVAQGAATSVWCLTSARLDGRGGVYCEDTDIAAAVAADSDSATGVRQWATDPALADRLWELSERLTRRRAVPPERGACVEHGLRDAGRGVGRDLVRTAAHLGEGAYGASGQAARALRE